VPNSSPQILLRAVDSALEGWNEVAASSYREAHVGMSEIAVL
jgi:hypothetical protein